MTWRWTYLIGAPMVLMYSLLGGEAISDWIKGEGFGRLWLVSQWPEVGSALLVWIFMKWLILVSAFRSINRASAVINFLAHQDLETAAQYMSVCTRHEIESWGWGDLNNGLKGYLKKNEQRFLELKSLALAIHDAYADRKDRSSRNPVATLGLLIR